MKYSPIRFIANNEKDQKIADLASHIGNSRFSDLFKEYLDICMDCAAQEMVLGTVSLKSKRRMKEIEQTILSKIKK